ncbi:hypothetical protein POM88_030409 [Heracleum sosnowskyi]|uniref:Fibronectin type III-like domain-containing protein n=1 Tax=Heracleum sosnowskyi TaxID=360622 RepID=A0AAD8HWW9_9APIA|nr:hypothetical protein POM88_030409 [Heracleum sosnowskyi]
MKVTTKYSLACKKEVRTSNFIYEVKVVVLVEALSEEEEGQQGQVHFDIRPIQNHILLLQRSFSAKRDQTVLVGHLQNLEQRKGDSNHTQAILWAGYPGQEGGRAIADVIFGKHNPGGRLPLTWYPSNYTDTLPMTSMQLRPHDGLVKIEDLKCDKDIEFEVEFRNNGRRDGTETAIVYSIPPKNIKGVQIKQVVGFKSVFIHARKTVTVKFVLNVCKSFFIVNYNAYRLLPSGQHTIMIGDKVLSFPVQIKIEGH